MPHLHSAPIAAPRAAGNNSLNTAVAGSKEMCVYILPCLSLRFQVPAMADVEIFAVSVLCLLAIHNYVRQLKINLMKKKKRRRRRRWMISIYRNRTL